MVQCCQVSNYQIIQAAVRRCGAKTGRQFPLILITWPEKTIRLFFKTADCTFRKHFGYAYVDVNTECSGEFTGAAYCPDDTAVNVVAPYGYQSYKWLNSTLSEVIGSNQTLTLSPTASNGYKDCCRADSLRWLRMPGYLVCEISLIRSPSMRMRGLMCDPAIKHRCKLAFRPNPD